MNPAKPVFPGHPEFEETTIAKGQEEYLTLQGIVIPSNPPEIITRWELTEEEKELLGNGGFVYLSVLGRSMNPVIIRVATPEMVLSEARSISPPAPEMPVREEEPLRNFHTELTLRPRSGPTIGQLYAKQAEDPFSNQVTFARYPDNTFKLFKPNTIEPAGYSQQTVSVRADVRRGAHTFVAQINCTRQSLDLPNVEEWLTRAALSL